MVQYRRRHWTLLEKMHLNAQGWNFKIRLPRVDARLKAIQEASKEASENE